MLEEVTLKNSLTHINKKSLQELIKTCDNLKKIDLTGTTFIADDLYRDLISLKNLRCLGLSMNKEYLNKDKLLEIVFNCFKIEELKLYNFESLKPVLTDEIVLLIVGRLESSLRSLKLDCSDLGPSTLKAILKCSRLETLCLRNAVSFASNDFRAIPKKLHLKYLKIGNPYNLKNEDLLTVFHSDHRRMGNLHSIGFPFFNNLEDSGFNAILTMCGSNLKYIHIQGCKNVSSDMIMNIIKSCYKLKYLNIAFIPSISQVSYSKCIPKYIPHLSVFIVDGTVNYNDLKDMSEKIGECRILISESTMYKKLTQFNFYHRKSLTKIPNTHYIIKINT